MENIKADNLVEIAKKLQQQSTSFPLNKDCYGILKIATKSDPVITKPQYPLYDGFLFSGKILGDAIKINNPLIVFKDNGDQDYLRTSPIRSVYLHGSEDFDKLILPSEFGNVEHIKFEDITLIQGDYLLATMNSIYLLRSLEDKNDS